MGKLLKGVLPMRREYYTWVKGARKIVRPSGRLISDGETLSVRVLNAIRRLIGYAKYRM